MSIAIICPRCKTSLNVPGKLAGQYAFCPKCQGRLWVPKDGSATHAAAPEKAQTVVAAAAAPGAPPPSNPLPPAVDLDPMAPVRLPPTTPPGAPARSPSDGTRGTFTPASESRPTASVEPPPPVTAPPTRRVAQFITADAAQSQLTLAPDGKLPELHLSTDETGTRKKKSLTGGNSWGVVALVSVSLLISFAVLLLPGPGSNEPSASRDAKENRTRLRNLYFGSDAVELRPYQILLRRAQQAHDRGDRNAERQYYLEVMRLLRDENLHPLGRSLTGMIKPAADQNLPSDEDLEKTLADLLSER